MALHSVRFDDETEEALAHVCEAMGCSVSQAIKNGVLALREQLASRRVARPFDVYQTIELGPGGYLKAPARNAKRAIADIVKRKHGR